MHRFKLRIVVQPSTRWFGLQSPMDGSEAVERGSVRSPMTRTAPSEEDEPRGGLGGG